VGSPFWRELFGGVFPEPVAVADALGADGEADCDRLGEALGVDGVADGEGLPVGDGAGGAAGVDGVAGALPAGDVEAALLGGASGTLARMSSGSAVSREGPS
jgi:hypothetical protein